MSIGGARLNGLGSENGVQGDGCVWALICEDPDGIALEFQVFKPGKAVEQIVWWMLARP